MKRFTKIPFPTYSYVPGKQPHPRSNPDGHSYGRPEPVCQLPQDLAWSHSQEFLFAIDLFNYGFYWEAHEQWEAVWIALGRTGTEADFIKGLVKLAAMGVKAKEPSETGFLRHQNRAINLFEQVGRTAHTLGGLMLSQLIKETRNENFAATQTTGQLSLSLSPSV